MIVKINFDQFHTHDKFVCFTLRLNTYNVLMIKIYFRRLQNTRKDTGYSTGSSHTSCTRTPLSADEKRHHGVSKVKHSSREAKLRKSLESDPDTPNMRRQRDKQYRRMKKDVEALSEEENMSENNSEMEEKKAKLKKIKNKKEMEETKLKMKMSGKKKEILELSSSDGSSE